MNHGVVVDASVALSWVLPGEDTKKALQLRDHAVEDSQVRLLVPPIFWYEVSNVLWLAAKRERITKFQALEALETLIDFQFDVCITNSIESLSIAFGQNVGVYGSAYLSLALEREAILWTLEKELIRAANNLNILVEPIVK